jgi:hypothetical protein
MLKMDRDNRRLEEMEGKAKTLRRRRYEAEKSLKTVRSIVSQSEAILGGLCVGECPEC